MLHSRRLRFPLAVLGSWLIAASSWALAGCGSSSKSAKASESATTAAVKLFPDDFTSVCQGVGQSRAYGYEATAAAHKAVYIQTFKDRLQDASQELPSDWTVQFDPNADAYAAVDLVGCGTRTASVFLKECTGYRSKGKETGQKVRLHTATYKVSVRVATTGKELGSMVLNADSTECPMFQSFDKDQKSVDVYQTPVQDEIVAFLKPFVQP